MRKVVIIGNGSIGKELRRRILNLGWGVVAVLNSADYQEGKWKALVADLVFLAIPSDDGNIALDYITHFVNQKIPVITCEKGALSKYFDRLQPSLSLIGYDATVGGGTKMISYLKSRVINEIDEVVGILNGTLNFIFSELARGKSENEVLKAVLDNRYAEPGATSFLEIIKMELKDLHKKSVILANLSGVLNTSIIIDGEMLIDESILINALNNPKKFRFMFSMDKTFKNNFIAGVQYSVDNWHIQAGIFDISNLGLVLPGGVDNGLFIRENDSVYSLIGPGAGPYATVSAMISNALRFI